MAISASLLPPAVNAGLLSSYSLLSASITSIGQHLPSGIYPTHTELRLNKAKNCTKFVDNNYMPIYSCQMVVETGFLGLYSFVLTMTNIICIIGTIVFTQVSKTYQDVLLFSCSNVNLAHQRSSSDYA